MGSIAFLTPLAALIALSGLLPLLAFLRRERRARRVRTTLDVAEPPSGPNRRLLAALVAVPVLAGLAAAQPVLDRSKAVAERADAEILFVLDTSRSMAAAAGPSEPTRFERARAAALDIRAQLPGVPAGVASLTDRTLPHLFPTSDGSSFRATLARSVGVERPPPAQSYVTLATDLTALSAVADQSFFSPSATKRLLVVLTDGETQVVRPRLGDALRKAHVRSVFVHVWGAEESIFVTSKSEVQYRPDPTSGRTLARAAALINGAVFSEDDVAGVVARARQELGEGPTRPRTQQDLLALMPYATLAAFAPLALVLRRRNV
jgi:hypothetical protein